MRLYHNTMSLNVFRNYSKSLDVQSKSLAKISSGYKINGAKDNPVKIGQSESMRLQIRGMQMAQKNVQDSVSLLQTADSSLEAMRNYLGRIRELAVQGANGTNTDADRDVINEEVKNLLAGFDTTYEIADANEVKFLNDPDSDKYGKKLVDIVSGANVGEKIQIPTFKLNSVELNLKDAGGASLIDVKKNSVDNLTAIDNAIDVVLQASSKYGALCNRFEGTINMLGENGEITQRAESNVRDADIAEEMIEFSRGSLLKDAGISMMAQTNNFPKDILRILERVK